MQVSGGSFIKYAMFPGIIPRIKHVFATGFSFMASVMAAIYFNIGLLPRTHPYVNSENYGRFGVRHVIAEAGRNLEYSRQNIDQVVLYFTLLVGILLLCLQVGLFAVSLLTLPVFASNWGLGFWEVFGTLPHSPQQDFAFIVLDRVFGVMTQSGTGGGTGFFQSCYSNTAVNCLDANGNAVDASGNQLVPTPSSFPTPLQLAVQGLLYFYALGLSVVALIIILYYVIAIVGETVVTGTPFGKRLNRAWFLPRILVFFALIAPVVTSGANTGVSGAQFITLSVANYGSNMATNAWVRFLDGIPGTDSASGGATGTVSSYLGGGRSLIARPNVPEVGILSQFFHVAMACSYAQKITNDVDVRPYLVRENSRSTDTVTMHDGSTAQYNEMGGTTNDSLPLLVTGGIQDFERAVMFSRYNTVVLRFGEYNPPLGLIGTSNPPGSHSDHWGYVEPTCGEIHIPVPSVDPYVIGGVPGLAILENFYLSLEEYLVSDPVLDPTAYCQTSATLPHGHTNSCVDTNWITVAEQRETIDWYDNANKEYLLGEGGAGTIVPTFDLIEIAYDTTAYYNNLLAPSLYRERGWAGAAIWYNRIANLNGIMAGAMQYIPRPFKYPMVMEQVAAQHKTHDANMSYVDRFNPRLQGGQIAHLPKPGDYEMAALLYSVYSSWTRGDVQETVFTKKQGNAILDAINSILGTHGLVDIRDNLGTHPLAMLSSLGKSMVDASLRNLFVGIVGQGIGEILSDDFIGSVGKVAGGFAFKFAMIGFTIGFVLFYVVPLMPFVYFFFAFSGWIKSIFEAVVAMPLWAIAHLKLDGEGLPGPWATNGYFLLMEILIRPTLIIVGLIASVGLFSALVDGLHDVHTLLVYVTTGFDFDEGLTNTANLAVGESTLDYMRGPLDEFFYTVIYTIIVYMIGVSSFKMIDSVPNNIMRWMGVTVSTFQENAGDPAGKLASQMYRGSNITNIHLQTLMGKMSADDLTHAQILHK